MSISTPSLKKLRKKIWECNTINVNQKLCKLSLINKKKSEAFVETWRNSLKIKLEALMDLVFALMNTHDQGTSNKKQDKLTRRKI